MVAVRGAITVDSDNAEDVLSSTGYLLSHIIEKNGVKLDDIIDIVFTCTSDIRSAYPARAARDMGILHAGLICVNEMDVEASLKKCIRILMHINTDIPQNEVKHIYLRGAASLRPDLTF